MIVIIAGSRDFKGTTADIQQAVEISRFNIELLINGCADGVDTQAQWWAVETGTPFREYPVTEKMWKEQGKRAGYNRNRDMAVAAEYFNALVHKWIRPGLIALWDYESPGTKMMIEIAEEYGFQIYIHKI